MISKKFPVCVIGAGLAGCECAWQLAKFGVGVALIEMRPHTKTPAHHTGNPAELVCSNSFRSNDRHNAVGLIKEEMQSLDSLIVCSAYKAQVPAGSALAVDRDVFSKAVADGLDSLPAISKFSETVVNIEKNGDLFSVICESGNIIECAHCVIATGPLTHDKLAQWILAKTGEEYLYFYDSIAPIVDGESINMKTAFRASRYGKGSDDYINCAMTKESYEDFIAEIAKAELIEVHDFDRAQFFEGCLPIEEMVRRGPETLRYGPLKPVGITHPDYPEKKYHAVVQLRQDNLHATLFNMVGFQTRMKWGEQQRIFRKIPGLENVEFVRLGSMHRNTYLCSPKLLQEGLELKSLPGIHFAGQITGCEGYVESAAVGLYVGLCLGQQIKKQKTLTAPPTTTALGALIAHILHADPKDYQPMNINFGLFKNLEGRFKKTDRKIEMVKRASEDLRTWLKFL